MSDTIYHIGERSITSPRGIKRQYRIVTAADMGIDDKQFAGLVSAGRIKKGPPPQAPKAEQKRPKPLDVKTEKTGSSPDSVLREDRIFTAIKAMFREDGTRISDDDFTGDDKPSCDALTIAALEHGESEVSASERDAAWERYEKEKTTPQGK